MRRFKGLAVVVVSGVALTASLTACGSSDDKGSSDSGSGSGTASASAPSGQKTVKAVLIVGKTGVAGTTGAELEKGIDYAVKDTGDVKIDLTVMDTGSNQATAVSDMSKALKSDPDVIIYGNLSNEALAIAPLAQKAGVPLLVAESAASGIVETGDHIFRVTGSQVKYQALLVKYLQSIGVKTEDEVYTSDSPATAELATKTWPGLVKQYGISIPSKFGVSSTDTDFTAIASKIAKENPDAVHASLIGAQYTTLFTQLRRDGWKGEFAGGLGMTYGVVDSLGAEADHMSLATDFVPETPFPQGQAFAKAYQAATGKEANLFNGAGADVIRFLVQGAKAATGDISAESMTAGLTKASQAGYEGVAGKVTFTDRDATVPGIVVVYTKGKRSVPVTG
jgi:branched-chain amino acid transport system substrate-binding protein